MALTQENMDIVLKKEQFSLPPTIEPFEIIPIINAAWPLSFGCEVTDHQAISDRGWNPFNRNLLLNNKI